MSTSTPSHNSFNTAKTLKLGKKQQYHYHSLAELGESGYDMERLPFSIKILLENLLRREDGATVTKEDIEAVIHWQAEAEPDKEIFFMPARVLLQDFTGVPAVADLAAMRAAVQQLGGKAAQINPFTPADLVIDHSVQVDHYGSAGAFGLNAKLEFQRNRERYEFLKWGQQAFDNFHVVPPDSGIVHQVNLEHLAPLAMTAEIDGEQWVYPDTVIGTDSHTTMINGLGVLGWGVGGIEAEAALLGQPSSMLIPQVVGFKLSGDLPAGVTATDLVLAVTERLRQVGVVGKFVEFFGPGLSQLGLADRATIANMAPEYGATCGIFPVDEKTMEYMRLTGRDERAALAEAYFHAQGLWFDPSQPEPHYSQVVEFDLGTVEPSLAGPSRPQDRVNLSDVRNSFRQALAQQLEREGKEVDATQRERWLGEGGNVTLAPELEHIDGNIKDNNVFKLCAPVRQPDGTTYNLCHGSVVIAAITSCTNTSNPAVLMAAGLLARNAVKRGLQTKPWVKTSLAPGSKVVTDYLIRAGLMPYLEGLRFHLAGYGCTTCIGNSGPLPDHISAAVRDTDLAVAAVLSGNRNFEGRINPQVKANYLASPPLVVAYALAGNLNMDLTKDPLGIDPNGEPVYLQDIWPDKSEVDEVIRQHVSSEEFKRVYSNIFNGDESWRGLAAPEGELFQWHNDSTYIKEPPFFHDMSPEPPGLADIQGARVLVKLGDSVTTDHISPAGAIAEESAAGQYLIQQGVKPQDFNSYGARRGNHEVMVRGTFANIRLRNQLAPGTEGGMTRLLPDGAQMTIYDAAQQYQQQGTPLIVLGGTEYGTGSSRDWAAKGTLLLGVKAVIAQSYERIHRSNLVGMGVLPLQFQNGDNADKLGLSGEERFDIVGLENLEPAQTLTVKATADDGKVTEFQVRNRIDTAKELEYVRHGGILPYVLRQAITS
ncbi:aconitate hydratase [Candidatus Tenderia electrophaga]|jgi:aconitate hydratase|uniref:Aconitate hydratase n=1 Tax=Candidatus Tenderia electrophaga TaxID=1748243 RepID=A0A0S2TBH8_9GAMM|nr:aconitate hydratase [Candidatus Tenderia electrophaga]